MPATRTTASPPILPPLAAAGLLLVLGVLGHQINLLNNGRTLAFALWLGVALGFVFQRARFCFFCHARDWFDRRDPRGLLAIILAIAVGLIGYTVVLGSWLPTPIAGRLPPDIHIGPVSWVLVVAGLAFGLGMVISGSCISAHWYRLAEGSTASPFALLGTAIGFLIGFKTWNPLYASSVSDAPVVWLPAHLGYGGALVLQLGMLGALAWLLWRHGKPPAESSSPNPDPSATASATTAQSAASPRTLRSLWQHVFTGRWPYWTGGLAVGVIGFLAIVRMRPLGVTTTLGSTTRGFSSDHGWIPERLDGLDGFAGCATAPGAEWLTPHAVLLAGLIGGAFVAALLARQFKPRLPGRRDIVRGLLGGILLGWGAMTGLGCSIGTLLSGSMAGALSGWVFGAAMFLSVGIGLRVSRRGS